MPESTSETIASLAGRILAVGDPLANKQVQAAILKAALDASPPNSNLNSGILLDGIRAVFVPYVDNMLSLAGSALTQREGDLPAGSILVPLEIDYEKVANAFIGVIEGGYSPWLHSFHPAPDDMSQTLKRGIQLLDGIWYATAAYWRDGGAAVLRYDKADEDEGAGGGEITLSKAEITLGLGAMATKAPRHFADLMSENDDAITHDVFAQCCIFGDIIYG